MLLRDKVGSIDYIQKSFPKTFLYYGLSIITFGLYHLIFSWLPLLQLLHKNSICSLEESDALLVHNRNGVIERLAYTNVETTTGRRNVIHRHMVYTWIESIGGFKLEQEEIERSFGEFLGLLDKPMKANEIKDKIKIYGKNSLVLPLKSINKLLLEQMSSPLTVYQIIVVIIWYFRDYAIYCNFIVLLTGLTIIADIYAFRKGERRLQDLSKVKEKILVYRRGWIELDSEKLVPGDLVILKKMSLVPADLLLLKGECLVDESLMTGESIPIAKTGLSPETPDDIFDLGLTEHLVLYGTTCLTSSDFSVSEPSNGKSSSSESGEDLLTTKIDLEKNTVGLVIRTGFYTEKGKIVSSIIFSENKSFKYQTEAYKFVGALFVLGVLISATFVFYAQFLATKNYFGSFGTTIIYSADLFLTILPPGLPLSLLIGTSVANARLVKKKITPLSNELINAAGRVKVVAFDKTGTLTESDMDLEAVWVRTSHATLTEHRDLKLMTKTEFRDVAPVLIGCHNLGRSEGKMLGDPMEAKIFEGALGRFLPSKAYFTKFPYSACFTSDLLEGNDINSCLFMLRKFLFKSEHHRMTNIISIGQSDRFVTTKGAPETIRELCKPGTVPVKFAETLDRLTKSGKRILAMATRKLSPEVI